MTEARRPALLGAILRDARIIRDEDIRRALDEQERTGVRFGEALVRLGLVSREDVSWALAGQLDLPFVRARAEHVDPAAIAAVPAEVARRHRLLPYLLLGDALTVVVDEPPDAGRRATIEGEIGRPVNVCLGLAEEIDEALSAAYGARSGASPATPTGTPEADLGALLASAAARRAEAIHVEPSGARHVVRFRESGHFVRRAATSTSSGTAWIARVRGMLTDVVASPGAVEGLLRTGDAPGYRASILDADLGPSMTLTPIDPPGFPTTLDDALGDAPDRKAARALLSRRSGLLVVAGTDAARTLRLVACLLDEIDRAGRKPFHLGRANWFAPQGVPHVAAGRAEGTSLAAAVAAASAHGADPLVITGIDDNAGVRAALAAAADRLVIAPLVFSSAADALAYLVAAAENAPLVASRVAGVLAFASFPALATKGRTPKPVTRALAKRLGLPWRKGARVHERRPPSRTGPPDMPRDVLVVDLVAGRNAAAAAMDGAAADPLRAKALALLQSGRIALRDFLDRFER